MSDTVKNVLAVVVGIAVGMAVNMGIIRISGSLIPLPDGVDATTMEGLKKGIHLFQPKHYLMPFLAHALGTFAGAALAVLLAASQHFKFAMGFGIFFLLGGIANAMMLPAAMWFIASDLLLAYLPMGWLAWFAFGRNK